MADETQKIVGYRQLTPDEIEKINSLKSIEASIGEIWLDVAAMEGIDRRWHAMARTHFEQAFMALTRCIARPKDNFAPPSTKE